LFEPTGSRRDAASVIFNLPGYRVIDAVDLPLGGRRVKIQPVDLGDGCPECWVISDRVHGWGQVIVQTVGSGSLMIFAEAGVKVRRGQAGSAHTNLGLRTTTATWPACGMSRTRCYAVEDRTAGSGMKPSPSSSPCIEPDHCRQPTFT
jgi:hypothetical protein